LKAVQDLFLIGCGVLFSAAISFLLYLPDSKTSLWWHDTALFFKNPLFGVDYSLKESIFRNLSSIFTEPTLIYFCFLTILIFVGYFFKGKRTWNKNITFFVFIYGIFAFLYFLKSPGWFKYLLPLQLFIFIYLPPALITIAESIAPYIHRKLIRVSPRAIASVMLVFLIAVQLAQLLFFAKIYSSNDVSEAKVFLETQQTSTSSIAFIHTPQLAMFFPADKKYSLMVVNEELSVGENPLYLPLQKLPTFIVLTNSIRGFSTKLDDSLAVLNERYSLIREVGRFNIFKLKIK
jgi:hypothetical protein